MVGIRKHHQIPSALPCSYHQYRHCPSSRSKHYRPSRYFICRYELYTNHTNHRGRSCPLVFTTLDTSTRVFFCLHLHHPVSIHPLVFSAVFPHRRSTKSHENLCRQPPPHLQYSAPVLPLCPRHERVYPVWNHIGIKHGHPRC